MSILNSRLIQNIIGELSGLIRQNKFNSNDIPKFVFICGEQILNDEGIELSSEELYRRKNKRQLLINKLSTK